MSTGGKVDAAEVNGCNVGPLFVKIDEADSDVVEKSFDADS